MHTKHVFLKPPDAIDEKQTPDIEDTLQYLEKTDIFDIFQNILKKIYDGNMHGWPIFKMLYDSLTTDPRIVKSLKTQKDFADHTIENLTLSTIARGNAYFFCGLFYAKLAPKKERNVERALSYYEKAIALNHPNAIAFFGKDAYTLKKISAEVACEYFNRAIALNCSLGWSLQADFYLQNAQFSLALKYFQLAAQQKDPLALEWLGSFYKNRLSLSDDSPLYQPTPSYPAAIHYLKAAIYYGYTGLFELSEIFYYGYEDVPCDIATAMRLMQIESKLGNHCATGNCGLFYLHTNNYPLGIFHLDLAIGKNIEPAQEQRTRLYREKKGTDYACMLTLLTLLIEKLIENEPIYLSVETIQSFRKYPALADAIIEKIENFDLNKIVAISACIPLIKQNLLDPIFENIEPLMKKIQHCCTIANLCEALMRDSEPPQKTTSELRDELFRFILIRSLPNQMFCLQKITEENSAFHQFFKLANLNFWRHTDYIKRAKEILFSKKTLTLQFDDLDQKADSAEKSLNDGSLKTFYSIL